MAFAYSFAGKGIDASLHPTLKEGDFTYFYKLPDNTYRIQHVLEPGSYDYLFSKDLVFYTKYHRILLKEWFYMLRAGGKMVIEFQPGPEKTPEFLAGEARLLFGKRAEVKAQSQGELARLVIVKEECFEYEKHGLDEWSFGIITNGKADDNVDLMIENIFRVMKVPKFELFVCGTYNGAYLKSGKIRYIPFSERDDLGWITKKKNLIAKAARYENIAILHDRIFLEDDWLTGMRQWGRNFEIMACELRQNGDEVVVAWGTSVYEIDDPRRATIYNLDRTDWDPWAFVGGSITLIKKSVWAVCGWDEERFWNHEEDIALSHSLSKKGYLSRYNLFSVCYTNKGPKRTSLKLKLSKSIHGHGDVEGPLYNQLRTLTYSHFRRILGGCMGILGIKYKKTYKMKGYEREKLARKRYN